MAMILATLSSLGTRVIEYTMDYDGKVKRYLASEDEEQKGERWQAIMDNIALYPTRHSTLLLVKFGADSVLLYGVGRAVAPIIKSLAQNIWQKIKTCLNKFMEFLNQMYNAAYDLYQSSNITELTDKVCKCIDRITKQIMESWEQFVNFLAETLKTIKTKAKDLWKWIKSWTSVDVSTNANGQTVLTMSGVGGTGGSALTYIPEEMITSFFNGTYRVITSVWTWIISSVGLLIQWISGQIKVEALKYYCSFVGLTNYYINRVPTRVGRMRL